MKKLITTKLKIFMLFLLITSITCFTSSMVILYRSDFKLSDYTSFDNRNLGWGFDYHNDYSALLLDEPLTNIQNLNIDLTGYDVTLEVYPGSNLIINGSSNSSTNMANSLNVINTDGTLNISPSNTSGDLLIKLPSSYAKNLDFKFTNGSTNLSTITLESLKIQGINSNINIDNLSCTSGNVSITNGNITLTNITSKDLSVDILNGDVHSTDLKGNINLKTISGDIFAGLTNEVTNAKINSTNGNINLAVPTNNNFTIDYNTVNGEFDQYSNSSKFPKYDITRNDRNFKITMGTGIIPISITTVDGNLSLE